jgi:hypothetical protein
MQYLLQILNPGHITNPVFVFVPFCLATSFVSASAKVPKKATRRLIPPSGGESPD